MSTEASLLARGLVAGWCCWPAPALGAVRHAEPFVPQRDAVPARGASSSGRLRVVPPERASSRARRRPAYDCHWVRRKDDRYQTRLGTAVRAVPSPDVVDRRPLGSRRPGRRPAEAVTTGRCRASRAIAPRSSAATSVTCVGCHQKDFASTTSPNHAAAGFPTTCEVVPSARRCDVAERRGTGAFSHNSVSSRSSASTRPQACATLPQEQRLHRARRATASGATRPTTPDAEPEPRGRRVPASCETCHRHRATDPGSAAPDGVQPQQRVCARRRARERRPASRAIKNNVFKGTPRECVGCHQANYNRTQSPNHVAAGFSTTCETCHRPTDPTWGTGAAFNHNAMFALVGRARHARLRDLPHEQRLQGHARASASAATRRTTPATQNPNHVAAGFPTTCESCHRPTDPTWSSGSVQPQQRRSPLVGTHATPGLRTCHANNVYRGHARELRGCHQAHYNATQQSEPRARRASRRRASRATGRPTRRGRAAPASTTTPCSRSSAVHASPPARRATSTTCTAARRERASAATSRSTTRRAIRTTRGGGLSDHVRDLSPGDRLAWTQGTFTHTRFPLTGPHNVTCAQCHTTPNNFTTVQLHRVPQAARDRRQAPRQRTGTSTTRAPATPAIRTAGRDRTD